MRIVWVDTLASEVVEINQQEVCEKVALANKLVYLSDYCGEPLLIVGRGPLHGLIFNQLAEQEFYRDMSCEAVCGAGHIKDGGVVDWSSSGFGLTTSEELRPVIVGALLAG